MREADHSGSDGVGDLDGRAADLRVVVVAGRATHAVVRTSLHQMTNLHLGGSRGDLDSVRRAIHAAGGDLGCDSGRHHHDAVFVADHDKLNHRTRVQSFEEAMGKLAAANPNDTEAAILHALVTSANFNPADKTYANQLKAARILEPLFQAQPDHPGVAHYLIHSYDYPPIAKHGVAAARKYAGIAPDAPHAQHMPSHIFTRLGYWEESIAANRASAKAGGEATYDSRHATDYMVYAHLRLSDKPTMGSVTAGERAADSVELARIAFGGDLAVRTVMTSLINASSPLVWDATMLDAAETYALANQACIITPFILAGAMAASATGLVPVAKAVDLVAQLRGHTTGYAIPTFVVDAPSGGGSVSG